MKNKQKTKLSGYDNLYGIKKILLKNFRCKLVIKLK